MDSIIPLISSVKGVPSLLQCYEQQLELAFTQGIAEFQNKNNLQLARIIFANILYFDNF